MLWGQYLEILTETPWPSISFCTFCSFLNQIEHYLFSYLFQKYSINDILISSIWFLKRNIWWIIQNFLPDHQNNKDSWSWGEKERRWRSNEWLNNGRSLKKRDGPSPGWTQDIIQILQIDLGNWSASGAICLSPSMLHGGTILQKRNPCLTYLVRWVCVLVRIH